MDGHTPLSAAALAFVDDLARPELSEEDAHHLRRVLRIRDGAPVAVADGKGGWRICALGHELDPVSEPRREPRPEPMLSVGFSVPKGDRPELVVQKLTELGIDRVLLVQAERTIVRWGSDRAERHVSRLRRVAKEAAMQCRRTTLPDVSGVLSVKHLAGWPGAVRADRNGVPPSLSWPVVTVGPEGGWTDAEIGLLPQSVTLGPLMMRIETAAIAAGVILSALRSRLVAPSIH